VVIRNWAVTSLVQGSAHPNPRCDSTVRGATPSAAFMTLSGRMAFANPPLVFSHAIRFSTGEGAEPRSEIIVQPVIAVCEEEGVEGHVGGGGV